MQKWCTVLLIAMLTLSMTIFAQDKQPRQIVYIVSLQGDIFEGLMKKIQQKLKRIDTNQAKAVILEIDTPGGGVHYVEELCRDIDNIAQVGVPIYAYITGRASSGGALVSLACNRIYMKEQAHIGSAQVKILTPWGLKDADEKILSDMRAKFRAYAQHREYPPALAEAMVDPSLEVWEIHYRGERFFKTGQEKLDMQNRQDFNAKDYMEKNIVAAGKLANFTAKESKDYGICREIYQSRAELLEGIGLSQLPLQEIEVTSSDMITNFLTNPWIRFFLIALGILGIVIELMTPGFGVPGILGLTFLALFFAGGYLAEVTAVWEIVLFILGFALIAMEIFVTPGVGILGISGAICCFIALLLSFQSFVIPHSDAESTLFMTNLFIVTSALGLDIVLFLALSRYLPDSAPLQRLSVSFVQKPEEGFSVAIPALEKLAGMEGVAISALRPAGRIEVAGTSYDAVTQGDFVIPGEKVRILEVQGNRIIVNKVPKA